MSLDNVEDSIKLIVVGDGSVGKTSMLRRYVKGVFTDQYKKTIGAEFMEKDVYVKSMNQTVKLMLWDTAGQEVFNALTASYYRGAGAAIIAFSTTDRDSFMNVLKWKDKVEAQCPGITMVLCQTKLDLLSEAKMTNEEAEGMAAHLRLPFFRISTKDDFNVSQLFEFVAQQSLTAGAQQNDGGVDVLHSNTQSSGKASRDVIPSSPKTDSASGSPAADAGSGAGGESSAPKKVDMKEQPKKDEKKKKSGFSCNML